MSANLAKKARDNRSAALHYIHVQKSRLVSLTDYRLTVARRTPLPACGFSSIRAGSPNGAAA